MQDKPQGATLLPGQDIGNVCQMDGKTLARTNWLRLWPKNPRVIDSKNLKKLEGQIKELGIYKPLLITPDGEILGGNQRFKIIKELAKKDEKYQWVWVSIVEAWTDTERLKYALSDNFSAGEYTREKLKEVINLEQRGLFSDYDIEFGDKQDIDAFIDSLAVSEAELQLRQLENTLKQAGIDEEIIKDVQSMSKFGGDNRFDIDFNEETITGSGVCSFKDKKVFILKLLFDTQDEAIYNELLEVYGRKDSAFTKTKRLIDYLKSYENK